MTFSQRIAFLVAVPSLAGLIAAGVIYKRYHDEHLRKPPPVPRCAIASRRSLRDLPEVAGTEPHDDIFGQTVYLRAAEDKVVQCAAGISTDLSRKLTTAFSEIEPERRALEMLRIVKESPQSNDRDQEAHAAFQIARAATAGLPVLPETKAALEEIDRTHACRFSIRTPCASRPPTPTIVWAAGVPSAIGLLVGLSIFAQAGLAPWIQKRQSAREAKNPKG